MMNKSLYFLTFVIGAAIGSAATWQYVKKKYEKIAQEEIDSVKERFSEKRKPKEETPKKMETEQKIIDDKPDLMAYAAVIAKSGYAGYTDYSAGSDAEKRRGETDMLPYVISPEEFGEFDDYEKISLTYYADGVLADDRNEIIDDVEAIIGDALKHFGEYEEDSVFVRCDERQCDYEILRDYKNYSDL